MPDRRFSYNAFNFTVEFGNDARDVVTKIPGMFKAADETPKRGIISIQAMFDMFKTLQNGKFADVKQTVTIILLGETLAYPVQKWMLIDAFPIRHTGPALSAKGGGTGAGARGAGA